MEKKGEKKNCSALCSSLVGSSPLELKIVSMEVFGERLDLPLI